MTKVYVLLGGLIGPDGWPPGVNFGMFNLAAQIRKIDGVDVSVYAWSGWQFVWRDIQRLSADTKIAIVGYSGGGSRATYIENSLNRKIDLIIGYDPSPAGQTLKFKGNVQKSICYWNKAPLMFGLGGGVYSNAKTSIVIPIAQQHMLVQYNQTLHNFTLNEIIKL